MFFESYRDNAELAPQSMEIGNCSTYLAIPAYILSNPCVHTQRLANTKNNGKLFSPHHWHFLLIFTSLAPFSAMQKSNDSFITKIVFMILLLLLQAFIASCSSSFIHHTSFSIQYSLIICQHMPTMNHLFIERLTFVLILLLY